MTINSMGRSGRRNGRGGEKEEKDRKNNRSTLIRIMSQKWRRKKSEKRNRYHDLVYNQKRQILTELAGYRVLFIRQVLIWFAWEDISRGTNPVGLPGEDFRMGASILTRVQSSRDVWKRKGPTLGPAAAGVSEKLRLDVSLGKIDRCLCACVFYSRFVFHLLEFGFRKLDHISNKST